MSDTKAYTKAWWESSAVRNANQSIKKLRDGKEKRVFLGMPGYGMVTAAAGRGFWRASQKHSVNYYYLQGSLLAQNFNGMWCAALNARAEGDPIEVFAMQHSDIEPQDYWLDTLIDEMYAKELDVLGVPAPIKDHKGLTSIAIGDPNDTWTVRCRLSLQEIFSLPETFTSADIDGQLLINTGLWVCRFDNDWAKKLHFAINDRIVFDRTKNAYMAQCEPEDWFFSRLCHELGLRVGCTRKIALNHYGNQRFTNSVAWGEPFDHAMLSESILTRKSALTFPHDVDGWLGEDEGAKLYELARGKDVLEIGSYCGRSTICIGQAARSVVSIDPHDGRGTPKPRNTRDEFEANLKRYGVTNVTSSDGTDLIDRTFDFIFIDGSHAYEDVASDIAKAMSILRPKGLLAFHDYRRLIDPGVTKAVDELLSAGAELLSVTNTLAVVRPLAAVPLEV